MKIIAENHAADLPRDAYAAPAPLMLDAIACDLRALYGETASDLPDRLLALARRLDRAPRHGSAQAA
ncbi:hypothetical protein [Methylobacterium dankookense]|uniref:Uncharacterized protein n=1 Tax=Methylobacterium dankookense TaxID=560405 RepID=A0A564FYM6_9HYPH|nr:hypothetical protein [Methylobacterium dankookense]GJD54539.1 hypothetical protein IFDJLNFL_0411 [Methylobacterium dankookense]VUF13289.1 hypothetical protein MTDSW087_02989 [Methylobacterium dankookense]